MTEPLPQEFELVLLLSLPRPRPAEVDRMLALLNTTLDWNVVMGALAVHRTTGVAWHNILQHAIDQRRTLRPAYFLKTLMLAYRAQRVMAGEQNARSAGVLAALVNAGVRAAILKGGSVASVAYPDPGMRMFYDNDLLVDRAALPAAVEALKTAGYVQGSWDYTARRIVPAARRDVVFFAVHSHQTYPYIKATPEALMMDCHRLDVHFSVDLMTGNRSDGAVSAFLDRRIVVDAWAGSGTIRLSTLSAVDMLVFGCLHFYKEAIHRNEVLALKDLVLYKLVDILALLEGEAYPVDPAQMLDRAAELGFTREVYYGLHHLDALYSGRVPAELLDRLRPDDLSYLHEVRDGKGTVHRWQRPVAHRFFDIHRLLELGAGPVVAMPGGPATVGAG
jgi:hypothetical protein